MTRTAQGNGIFGPLLVRAGRRQRVGRAFALAAKAAVPGLAVGLILAGAWRLTGAQPLLALALSVTVAPTLAGMAAVFATEDALRAAAELDRRAGLDGLLATGVEISRGGIRTTLAPVTLRRAQEAARSLDGSEIPLAPPAWARYLSLPGAVLVAILALPDTRARRPGRAAALPRGAAAGSETGEGLAAAPERRADEAREAARRETRRAIAAYKEAADRARRRTPLPAAPLIAPRRGGPGEGRAGARASRGTEGGAGDGEAPAPIEGVQAARLGRAGAGPADLDEAAAFRERFPQYEDLIRRYFAGR